jgi:hypothetical protein
LVTSSNDARNPKIEKKEMPRRKHTVRILNNVFTASTLSAMSHSIKKRIDRPHVVRINVADIEKFSLSNFF